MPLAIHQEFSRSVEVFFIRTAQRCLIFNQNARLTGSRRTRIELPATLKYVEKPQFLFLSTVIITG